MTIQQEVAALLESPVVQRINFHCGPSRIWGDGYRRIAAAIRRRAAQGHQVQVVYNTIMERFGCGRYRESVGRTQVMDLPFATMRTVQERAVAVHEATHALQDYCGNPMLQADSECAGYIAHQMYVHLEVGRFPYESRIIGASLFALFERCYQVAYRILTTPGGYAVTEREQAEIKGLVKALGGPYAHADTTMVNYDRIR